MPSAKGFWPGASSARHTCGSVRPTLPAATAAAHPPDDPPGTRLASHGLRDGPKKLVSVLLVLTLAVSGGLLAWHGLHRTSAAPPAGQTQTPAVPAPPEAVPDTVSTLCVAGDLVMHIPIINSCRTDDGYDFTGLFDDLK